MKTIVSFTLLLLLSLGVSACGEKVQPLENPQEDLYSVIYESDDFSILKRIEIDEDAIYIMIGYEYGIGKDTCTVGQYQRVNYLVEYKGEYYDFIDANNLNIISCDLLDELNIHGYN